MSHAHPSGGNPQAQHQRSAPNAPGPTRSAEGRSSPRCRPHSVAVSQRPAPRREEVHELMVLKVPERRFAKQEFFQQCRRFSGGARRQTGYVGNLVSASYRTYLFSVNEDYVNTHTFTIQLNASHVAALGRVSKSTGRLILVSKPGSVLTLPLSARNANSSAVLPGEQPCRAGSRERPQSGRL